MLLASSVSPVADPNPRPTGLADSGQCADDVLADLDALTIDDHAYDSTVINSICSDPHPLGTQVLAQHAHRNAGDNRIFPSIRRCEAAVTSMLGDLCGLPTAAGVSTSGGTEANLLAVLAAVMRWRDGGGTGRVPVLIPDNAHFSFDKILNVLPIRQVRVPTNTEQRVDVEAALATLQQDLALVVLTAGTSECGAVDDIPSVARVAHEQGVPVHVDAATGGFLVPFARELGRALPEFGFAAEGVTSVTIDPHKYGGAPIPSGHLLFRDAADRDRLRVSSHYRGTADHYGLLGTRPGAAVLATYAVLRHLGRDGYLQRTAQLFAMVDQLVAGIEARGLTRAFTPDLTVVGITVPDPHDAMRRLEHEGLVASVSHRLGVLRLVVHWQHTAPDLTRVLDRIAAIAGDQGGR